MREYDAIYTMIERQLKSFWDVKIEDKGKMLSMVSLALKKLDNSFGATKNKYYLENGFSPYNTVQYSVFLYFLSNIVGKLWGGG